MSKQIQQPQPNNSLSKILPLAGAAAGAIYAGPGGAVAGAGAGAGLGSVAGGFLQQQPKYGVESEGMSRRSQALGSDPYQAIAQANAVLPPGQFPETRKALEQAMAIAQRNQQIQGGY